MKTRMKRSRGGKRKQVESERKGKTGRQTRQVKRRRKE